MKRTEGKLDEEKDNSYDTGSHCNGEHHTGITTCRGSNVQTKKWRVNE